LNQKIARERERDSGHCCPPAQRPGPGPVRRVQVPDHRQGARLAGSRPEPHHRAAGDEDRDRVRRGRQHRAAEEDDDADQHHPLAAELISHHAEAEHRPGEGQRVRADHPLQRGNAGVQVTLDVAERHADDRVVQEGQEQHDAEDGQGDGAPAMADGRRFALGDVDRTDHR
jgi:hypothetical protein